ncbi:MAG: hypothetical protein DCF15_01355 [Phormidesmis priestleyi]|uniref:Uncharacterized protein n=1 Tax=Phormidesmis priestleyi TaxID=268141 RepID=A0A2W4XV25_9CYAN|nr:MAG: hypothetical protein DCF15_01355 [Phormidesmis priestleyi]
MEKKFQVTLPHLNEDYFANSNNGEVIRTEKSLMIVGANGTGKTRLGSWIENCSAEKEKVYRVSAHRALSMPDSISSTSVEIAKNMLLYGLHQDSYTSIQHNSNKISHKWQQKPAIFLQSDYEQLMIYLLSDHSEESVKYREQSKNAINKIEISKTKLDLVKKVWEEILPHRSLVIGGQRIQTKLKKSDSEPYRSSEMSDGERAIFYLIGQCLSALEDGIIVIDEPELHLHKSIQARLWNRIESLRPDCLFIYLTHDVDFAAAMTTAQKIWLKSFDGKNWDWELIEDDENLPDDLLLEVLGSRKSVVFVEGDNGSFDASLYRELLPEFLIIPVGSCTQVIQSVKAFKSNSQLHHLDVYGIVDRDRRTEQEIEALRKKSVFVLGVAEVENLFCTRQILECISNHLGRNAEEDFEKISDYLFSRLKDEFETQVSLRTTNEIQFLLSTFNSHTKGKDNIKTALQSTINDVNIDAIYNDVESKFQQIIDHEDYDALLRLYNRKSLPDQISGTLGLKAKELQPLVIRLLKSEHGQIVKNALKPFLNDFFDELNE